MRSESWLVRAKKLDGGNSPWTWSLGPTYVPLVPSRKR
jgi:hypothetical protein